MITVLLDESRFHDQYPARELMLTGQLFGITVKLIKFSQFFNCIINNSLLEARPLDIAKSIISANLKENGRKLDFAVKAIKSMRGKLCELK